MKKPIYVSLTSIYSRQQFLFECLQHIIKQTITPTKIFIYLSEDKSFFDEGFKNKIIDNKNLNNLLKNNIFEIIWGKDIGPYGKFLPLLKHKINEDCLIITIDDDTIYNYSLIENLVNDYTKYNCVINYRGWVPDINNNDLISFDYLKRIIKNNKHINGFATGKGGILYHPSFFKNVEGLVFRSDIYNETCKYADDIWLNIVRIVNKVPCYVEFNLQKWLMGEYNPKKCLHKINNSDNFVSEENKENHNSIQFRETIKKLRTLGFEV
jgi:hypothetical protein